MAHVVSLSCSPTLLSSAHLPATHIRVVNTGATGIHFSKNAPVDHLNTSASPIQVTITNGVNKISSASVQLKLKNLPPATRHGQVMEDFPRTLFGIAPLCNADLSITFTKHHVKACNQAGSTILKGWHPNEACNWYLPLVDKDHNSDNDSLFPSTNDTTAPSPTPPPPIHT
jgi:hypothetical protein